MPGKKKNEIYHGFEQGPIRPPSEAASLLIRVTRNCPWNRCTFCPVYKGSRFSLRDPEHVKADIDSVYHSIGRLMAAADDQGMISREDFYRIAEELPAIEQPALHAAVNWVSAGMRSVFLQDANSLIIKPEDLIDILEHLMKRFPRIERVTSYARSHTICRIPQDKLEGIRRAGLSRIHIGLESGSDRVLEMVKKGVTKAEHIAAGRKVKAAGFELSEYVMPGLGGRELSDEHARETADALNQINPDFIRLRTLAVPPGLALHDEYKAGRFTKCTDIQMAEELLAFLGSLEGIGSAVKSDHVLNLFEEVDGILPQDKEKMLAPIRRFLAMSPEQQTLYQVGRRLSFFHTLDDMNDSERLERARALCAKMGITPENVESVIEEAMNRFI
ncbi:MAG: radical SAM protein [Thermodesulfobacteriota bacterium]